MGCAGGADKISEGGQGMKDNGPWYIVKRGSEWLQCRAYRNGALVFSISPYDAWRTRRESDARAVAEKIGGDVWVFDWLNGTVKPLGRRAKNDA